ncbi:hypothetical protein JCM3770_006150 [Rhodotorula araucariae]
MTAALASLAPAAPHQRAPPLAAAVPGPTMALKQRVARNEARRKAVARDFRTDTITVPTEEMIALMQTASLGDSVYEEDEDTAELEKRVAQLAGKEAGLFCVSGTLSNQLAIRSHLTHATPVNVVTDARAHVHLSEAGGIAFHSQASTHTVYCRSGHHMTTEEVLVNCVFEEDVHSSMTQLVCVENTLSGMIFPQPELVRLREALDAYAVPLHCDGARMWDVLAKTGMSLDEACAPFHTVSLCMSKGLGAPVGSVLVGPKAFIDKARWYRKLFGGGLRQTGGLALAASHALTAHLALLPRVHTLAKRLAHGLVATGVALDLPVETGMVWLDPAPIGASMRELQLRAAERGITLGAPRGRVVLHFQIDDQAVDDLLEVVRALKHEKADEARAWVERVGVEHADEVMRRSRMFADGRWEGRIEGPRRSLPAYGRG